MIRLHKSKWGTYHAPLNEELPWAVHDSRGTIDGGGSCTECGACECQCPFCGSINADQIHGNDGEFCCPKQSKNNPDGECIGLSFSYYMLDDGSTNMCEACAEKEGLKIVDCDCK